MTPSEHGVEPFNYILRETYTKPILHEIHKSASPFWTFTNHFTVDPNDWGFDNIFPAPAKSWEQVWFRDWQRRANDVLLEEKRQKMGPFEKEVSYLTDDIRRNINRQIFGVDK